MVLEGERRSRESVLFITLDSCRYDTFAAASAPAIKNVAPLIKATAPSYFTFGSRAAMFMGFTPGVSCIQEPYINPKYGKLFKLEDGGSAGKAEPAYQLRGRNIIDGFRHLGFKTIGSGAVGWFNPKSLTGRVLGESFDHFHYAGNTWSIEHQLAWIWTQLRSVVGDVFVFLNVGETHVPYYFLGAPWSAKDNPCRPFQDVDRSDECKSRQIICCEFVDAKLYPLLKAFENSTVLICGDHGDCWGEDGLWEHGFSHWATLTVPLLVRLRGIPIRQSSIYSQVTQL